MFVVNSKVCRSTTDLGLMEMGKPAETDVFKGLQRPPLPTKYFVIKVGFVRLKMHIYR